MLALLVSLAAAVLPQGGSQADAPVGLTVVIVDVGQGDGIVLRSPSGQVHVVDAGPEGQGNLNMLPVINSLAPASYGYTLLSHFHTDHVGGMDDLLNARPFQVALDRGDVNRPSNTSVNSYLNAAGNRRQTIQLGSIYQLGGGASIRCVAVNGNVLGGVFVDPTTSAQEENSRCLALRLEYGSFSMWLGGDLTGGSSGTADVESPASLACGDVDVYKLNHHGSNTSTNQNLVVRLDPELAVVSCGVGNSFGHPTTTTVNRLNQAVAARALLSTTTGSASTIGFGVAGHIRVDTDGYRFRASAENGDFLDFFCDEVIAPTSGANLRLSEVHRDPNIVADTNGEYIEVVNVGPEPVGLRGLQLSDNAATLTIAANYMLVPGRAMVFQVDGAPSRNGGQPLGAAMPFGSISLGNSADNVTLQYGATTVDSLTYSSTLPGGVGIAAELRDLNGSQSIANYGAAPNVFGAGDRGTPGRRNDSDTTVHPVQVGVTVRADRFTLHATAIDHPVHFSVIGLSYGTSPGFSFGGALIPLNFDSLFQVALGAANMVSLVPQNGYRSVDIMIPQPNPVAGIALHAAHLVLDWSLNVPGVSPAVSFVLP